MLKEIIYLIFRIKFFIIFLDILLFIYYKNKINIKQPKVSVFLPIYNKEKFLKRSINSIQNQELKEIEIIAVNDYSTDYSIKILKKLAKNDKRIKIVNNDRNHGLLYSRAMGILNCTGEYVMNLDPDDQLEGKDNLKILYNYSKENNLDFVRFLHKRVSKNKLYIKIFDFRDKIQLKKPDYYITNKFIKRNVIIKCYQIFKKKIFLNKWNYHEDNIWNLLIRKNSKSQSIINKYIYLIMLNKESLMANKKGEILELKNRIYKIEVILEFKLIKKKVFFGFLKILKNMLDS